MTRYFPNVDPIYLYKRKGSDEDPFLYLEEERYVKNSSVILNEIPSYDDGVKVFKENGEEMIEVNHDSLDINEFRVDYTTGVVHFNNVMNGQKVIIKYYGTGYVDIPTTRIRIPSSDDDPLETLQDALDKVEDGIKTLEQLGSLVFLDNYNPEYHYKKWNFVNYNGKTYVAIRDNIGENPETSSSWKFVSGGVSVKGVYNPQYIYGINDVVANEEKTKLYLSKISNNTYPLTDTNAWMEIIDLDNAVNNMINIIDQQINQLNALKQELIESEEQRDLNEEERDAKVLDHISTMELFKEDLQEEENVRIQNENIRKANEQTRIQAEQVRQNNESLRQQAEEIRIMQEEARQQNTMAALNNINEALNNFENISNNVSQNLENVENATGELNRLIENTNHKINELDEFRYVGEYSSDVLYKKNNIVSYNGSSYIVMQDITQEIIDEYPSEENMIDDPRYFRLLALAGRDITELSIDGVSPDENGYISLETLGYVKENALVNLEEEIRADVNQKIGDLTNLKTTNRGNLVEAINELKVRIDSFIDLLN